jgi:hypothetical protein
VNFIHTSKQPPNSWNPPPPTLSQISKIKEQAYYAEKKAQTAQKAKATASADLSKVSAILTPLGY